MSRDSVANAPRTRTEELQEAVRIVREIGAIAESFFKPELMATKAKGDRDVVTAADVESERRGVELLRVIFPQDGIVAEEGSRVEGTGRRWHLDPVDGTLNFSRGLPLWSISLALFEDGRPVLGVVFDPLRGELFAGGEGLGVTVNGVPVTCSSVTEAKDAMLHLTLEFKDAQVVAGMRDVQVLTPRIMRSRNIGSAALALAYIAAGRLDAMVHHLANSWDFGAGAAMILAAGGVVSEIDGSPYREDSTNLLAAATRPLHDEISGILRDVPAH